MPDQPIVENAANGFLPADVIIFLGEGIYCAKIRFLDAENYPVTFDRWAAS